ncbi:antitermination protein N [Hafnia alvei]|uniref:transcriptional antitermination N peptide n=1 Tax=Hafnia alvei TaxID=569 RepID=UPI0024A8183D|nr:antitermination protein N [Hafnia alvei]
MIKPHTIKENCRSRRDEKRKAKQQAWAAANPILVGRKYQVKEQPLSVVRRAGYSPAPIKIIARKAFSRVKSYKMRIIRATYLFEYEFKRKPLPDGVTCLPEVALYAAGHRNKRKEAVHITK